MAQSDNHCKITQVNIISINCCRSWVVLDDILISKGSDTPSDQANIFLIQEPPQSLGDFYRQYAILKSEANPEALPGARAWRRAALLIPKSVTIRCSISKPDVISADIPIQMITGTESAMRLVCFYADKLLDSSVITSEISSLTDNHGSAIVAGDSNASSYLWSRTCLPAGDMRSIRALAFEEILIHGNFQTFRPPEPSFQGHLGDSYIDILAARDVGEIEFGFLPSVGDHQALSASISRPLRESCNALSHNKRYPSRTNWTRFLKILDSNPLVTPASLSSRDIDAFAKVLDDRLSTAVIRSTPKSNPYRTGKENSQPPWWNKDLKNLQKDYHAQRKQVRYENRTNQDARPETLEALKESKRAYFNAVKKAKNEHIVAEVCSMDETRLHKRFRVRVPRLATYDSTEILSHFFGMRKECPPSHNRYEFPSEDLLDDLGGRITDLEIEQALRKLATRKSCGWDNIFNEHIKYAVENSSWYKEGIKALLNALLSAGHYPKVFKRSDLCMIYKNNGREGPKAWRPIALMSCLGKFMELIIKNRLTHCLGQPPACAHGYCAHRSTITAVEHVTGLSHRNADDKMITTTFDVSSAFDKIAFSHIVDEVVILTGKPAWGKLISTYLHGNKVVLDNDHTFRIAGVAQGGVLAPICFTLSTWRMGRQVSSLNGPYAIRIALYADDICIKVVAAGILGLSQGLHDAVSIIKVWTEKADLQLDPQKNEAFTDGANTADLLAGQLANTDLEYIGKNIKPEIKWLGIWLNPRGTWRQQVEHALGKGKRALCLLRSIIGRDRNIVPKLAILGWKTHVLPTILYGCEIWGQVAKYKWYINKCTQLEATFGRLLFGMVKTAPTALAAKLLATLVEPIWVHTRLRYVRAKLHKIRPEPHQATPSLLTTLKNWGVTSITDREVYNLPNTVHVNPENLERIHTVIEKGDPPTIEWGNTNLYFFSDGSVIDKGNVSAKTGAGTIRYAPEKPLGFEGRAYYAGESSNIAQCELVGVERSLVWANEIAETRVDLKNLYICLDSQAALRAIQNALHNSDCTELTLDIVKQTHKWLEARDRRVHYWWVRGHCGHIYNELSDIFAGRAARGEAHPIPRQVKKPLSFTKLQITCMAHHEMEETWRKQRNSLAVSRIGLGLGRTQLGKLAVKTLGWKAEDRRRIFELLTFHSNTKGYKQHFTNETLDTRCRYCKDYREDMAHFFWCPSVKLTKLREEIWIDKKFTRPLSGERIAIGMALIRDSIVGEGRGLYRVRRFLRRVAPVWGEPRMEKSGVDPLLHPGPQ